MKVCRLNNNRINSYALASEFGVWNENAKRENARMRKRRGASTQKDPRSGKIIKVILGRTYVSSSAPYPHPHLSHIFINIYISDSCVYL